MANLSSSEIHTMPPLSELAAGNLFGLQFFRLSVLSLFRHAHRYKRPPFGLLQNNVLFVLLPRKHVDKVFRVEKERQSEICSVLPHFGQVRPLPVET